MNIPYHPDSPQYISDATPWHLQSPEYQKKAREDFITQIEHGFRNTLKEQQYLIRTSPKKFQQRIHFIFIQSLCAIGEYMGKFSHQGDIESRKPEALLRLARDIRYRREYQFLQTASAMSALRQYQENMPAFIASLNKSNASDTAFAERVLTLIESLVLTLSENNLPAMQALIYGETQNTDTEHTPNDSLQSLLIEWYQSGMREKYDSKARPIIRNAMLLAYAEFLRRTTIQKHPSSHKPQEKTNENPFYRAGIENNPFYQLDSALGEYEQTIVTSGIIKKIKDTIDSLLSDENIDTILFAEKPSLENETDEAIWKEFVLTQEYSWEHGDKKVRKDLNKMIEKLKKWPSIPERYLGEFMWHIAETLKEHTSHK